MWHKLFCHFTATVHGCIRLPEYRNYWNAGTFERTVVCVCVCLCVCVHKSCTIRTNNCLACHSPPPGTVLYIHLRLAKNWKSLASGPKNVSPSSWVLGTGQIITRIIGEHGQHVPGSDQKTQVSKYPCIPESPASLHVLWRNAFCFSIPCCFWLWWGETSCSCSHIRIHVLFISGDWTGDTRHETHTWPPSITHLIGPIPLVYALVYCSIFIIAPSCTLLLSLCSTRCGYYFSRRYCFVCTTILMYDVSNR